HSVVQRPNARKAAGVPRGSAADSQSIAVQRVPESRWLADKTLQRTGALAPQCRYPVPACQHSPCEQFLEGGVLADRIEVGIVFKERAGALREFDRALKVRDGLVLLAGEAFAAGDVVEQVGERRVARQQLASSFRRLSVIARLVESPQWRKQLPASRLVRLS